MSDLKPWADPSRAAISVASAWQELNCHPALQWVPPIWRHENGGNEDGRHAISAVERNLIVHVFVDSHSSTCVRLSTGPLEDRAVGDGIDPTTPAASIDPELTVTANSFEQAVLDLRDAVLRAYGAAGSESR